MSIFVRGSLLALLLYLAGCASTTSEVESLKQKFAAGTQGTESILFLSQAERRVAFALFDEILPTRVIETADTPFVFPVRPIDLSGVTYQVDDATYSLSDFTAMAAQIGLIAVKDGEIVFEHYASGHDEASRWVSFSVTKSVTSMLIGAAVQDGYIESVNEPVVHYLPRLRGTGYEGASIADILHMASGVAWNEDYADPNSDVALAGGSNGITLVKYLAKLPAQHEPGEVFNYNTGETNLVGEILRSALGNNAATYLTHKIWRPFGMTANANWLLDGEGGVETGGCCISATLRDYARIGMFALAEGVLADGTRVLPEGWMSASTKPSEGYGGYGYLWWLEAEGNYSARGIFGQQIFIAPEAGIVVAAHSNAPAAVDTDYHRHLDAAVKAIVQALR